MELHNIHPSDAREFWKNQNQFITNLYMSIKAEYASLYVDQPNDVQLAFLKLREAITSGFSSEEILQKARYVKAATKEQYRPSCARMVQDAFWHKKFQTATAIRQVRVAEPWDGPTPQHP